MANFWWGQSEGRKRTHWKSWDSMCTLKCLGGMGFQDLEVFNEALLGRQAWRLTTCTNSLLNPVMKAKYYRNSDFLGAYLGYGGSFSWRSIWGSKALVKEGVLWRVGNGRNINIWTDPWICDDEGRFATSVPSLEITKVNELIIPEDMSWDHELIQTHFNDRDTRGILAIPLSSRAPPNEPTWAFAKNDMYNVKSAYMLGKGLGVVGRDSAGSVLFAATKRIKAWWVVEIAEAKAMVWALSLGARFGYNKAIIETDCQTIVSRLSTEACYSTDLDLILGDAMALCSSYDSLRWSHVKRDGNSVAHNLAKLIPPNSEQIWENYVPPNIAPYVLMDYLVFPEVWTALLAKIHSPVEVLRGPNSRIWHVELVKVVEDTRSNMCFDIGWQNFVNENHLVDGELMIIYYAGNITFYVRVFSSTMVERFDTIEPFPRDEDI
ncbi:uncharacterized protein LOC110711198 [Chenopodium quinoa]|uniref:uncharacterized protein LOC110711198 n=1 Tax=Chenopodium quinoa TaxID=63459 RepID=UPI000B77192C|nr:uncharacterized protein LOC110711198 [Chenopodium quinoa]